MKTIFNHRERREHKAIFYVIFAIFVVISRLSVFAQAQQAWVAKYNNGITNGTNQAVKMVQDGAGNIYVTGFSQNATNGNLDYATIKYAPNGNQVWATRFVATNTTSAKPTGLVLDSLTNVIVTGSSCTVKYDNNGNQLWTAPYAANPGALGYDRNYSGNPVAIDASNNVFVTGFSADFGVVEINPGGTNVWEKTHPSLYPPAPPPYYPPALGQSLSVDTNGHVYVAGAYEFESNSAGIYFELMTIKYDTNGSLLWSEIVQQPFADQDTFPNVESSALDSGGNFYVLWNEVNGTPYLTAKFAGTNGSIVWNASNPTGNNGSRAEGLCLDGFGDAFATGYDGHYSPNTPYPIGTYKIGTNGAYLWTNLYYSAQVANSVGTSIAVDQANNAYITGYSPGTNTGNDIVTIKYDNNGNQIWLQRYNGPGSGDDEGNAIAVDAFGNVYVTGYETTAAGGTEMVTIKYAPAAAIQKQGNGSFLLQEQGEPGEAFDFQASTNLQTWLDLGTTNADTNGLVQFLDTNATNFAQRFYLSVPQ